MFKTLQQLIVETAATVRPAERLTVSQSAEKYRRLNNPGSYVGPWTNSLTPYLIDPMDELTSREFTGMIFVGPAQCGKTDMFINWHNHSVRCDPADLMLVQTSQTTARDFSIRRIDRLHRDNPEQAFLACPHCGSIYTHNTSDGKPGKAEMNTNGRWVKDGMIWTPEGTIEGTPFRSTVASFWLKGVAAAFSDWKTLVYNYLAAEEEYARTGSEESLKTTTNTDQGLPYTPKQMAAGRLPEELKSRAIAVEPRHVPPGVRFLIASVDVQKNRFVVQVHGTGYGRDAWVVDRFDVRKSERLDDDGERRWVNPGSYFEDWKLLASEVMTKTYPLADGSGRHMPIKVTVCDSGGREGVTANAYDFVRWLRAVPEEVDPHWRPGLAERFRLVKGAATKNAPRVAISYPDSQRRDRNAGARGEIPVALLNTNALKDQLDNMLDRKEPRGGRITFPAWLDDNFFTELTVEIKDAAKGWINPKRYRNESWDLFAYYLGALLLPEIAAEQIDWDFPPKWAADWAENDLLLESAESVHPFERKRQTGPSLEKLAEELG